MTIELKPFEAADHLTEAADQADLIADAFASGDTGYVVHALGVVARARGMTRLERDTGIRRQALYRALGRDGNPTLATLMKVIGALGLRLRIDEADRLKSGASTPPPA